LVGFLFPLFTAVFGPTIAYLENAWRTNPDASHGFLVPPIAGVLLWRARRRWMGRPRTAPGRGLALLLAALLIQCAAVWGSIQSAQPVALVLALAGVTAYLLGWAAFRAMLFPFAFLLFMVPWPDLLVERISFPMQLMTSSYAAMFAGLLGLPVVADGVDLYLPERGVSIAVAAACSGMRSLVALMAVASLFAYLLPASFSRRWLLFAAGVPLVLAANVVRVVLILLVGDRYGQKPALAFHDQSAPVLFALCSLGLLGASRLLGVSKGERETTGDGETESQKGTSPLLRPSPFPPYLHFVVPCVLLAVAGVVVRVAAEEKPGRIAGSPVRLERVARVAGPWRCVAERDLDAETRSMLAPDATLWRTYRRATAPRGAWSGEVDLLVVYGHRKQTFHSPAFCMPGSGYEVITKRQMRLPFRGSGTGLPVNAMTVQKGNRRLLVCYWYVQDGEATTGLVRHTAGLLWRRLRRERASGALIRMITPTGEADAPALHTIADFTGAVYPALKEVMRDE
jgi:EpsI family protein